MLCCTLHVVDRSASHCGKAACCSQSGECCVLYFACGALYGACCDAACCVLRAALRGSALGLAPLQLALDVRPRPAADAKADRKCRLRARRSAAISLTADGLGLRGARG